MIKYTRLGSDLQLNEIVIAGSHDAGITGGSDNAQTQALDILGQAKAGVRFFDIRVAAFSTGNKSYGAKQVELKSFHADDMVHKKETKTRSVAGFAGSQEVVRSKLKAGVEGMGLHQMLRDAKTFVETGESSGEFLILKFDKCTNWELIAETCRNVLGGCIYSDGGNINTKTLAELGGKVIVAFMTSGYSALKLPGQRVGITHIKNLYKPPAGYDGNFDGLQYWGAGGTGINNKGFEGKIRENISTQGKILKSASTGVSDKKTRFTRKVKTPGCAAADPNAIGMMYWTTTGVFKSIKARNDLMWDKDHVGGLDTIWKSGFEEYISNALPGDVNLMSFSSGGTLKLFMPNIVMIDFANDMKCDHIYGLNTIAAVKLVKVCQKLDIHGGRNG
jgi:hypothetical protein